MSQYVVTVKRLNKRRVVPMNFPDRENIIGELFEGQGFEATEADITEVPNRALGKWFKDRDGHFYWGGGLNEVTGVFAKSLASQAQFSWWLKNNKYSIPDLWSSEQMPKVTIAILDTGISQHIDFDFTKIAGFNYLDNSANFKTDVFGHGTHLAGIMVAKGVKSFGVIPGANLFVAKVCDNSGTPSFQAVKNALSDIFNGANGATDIDVVNMSFSLTPTSADETKIVDDITILIRKISAVGKCILVSACGDEDWEFDSFPAKMEECISVGSINTIFKRSSFSTRSSTLDIMAPGERILSSQGTDSSIERDGTSQSAAIVSAICARGIQEIKKNGSSVNPLLKKSLFQTAINDSFPLNEYGHGIFDPNKFLATVKTLV